MSALPFAIPHLDAINALPKGLLYPHQAERLEALARAPGSGAGVALPLLDAGVREFRSSRDPSQIYVVTTFGRGGHLECTCDGFRWRGNCKHVREVRAEAG